MKQQLTVVHSQSAGIVYMLYVGDDLSSEQASRTTRYLREVCTQLG